MKITNHSFQLEHASTTAFFVSYINVYNNRVIEVLETHFEDEETGSLHLTNKITVQTAQMLFDEYLADQEEKEYDEETNYTIDRAIELRCIGR